MRRLILSVLPMLSCCFLTLTIELPAICGEGLSATERMAAAHKARADWGAAFPGFTAMVEVNIDGKLFSGTTTVQADGQTTIDVRDAESRRWALRTLGSLVMHRRPGREAGVLDPARAFQFGEPDESHPLGRLIVEEGDDSHSSYRVRDGQLLEVNRDTGTRRFTITVLETVRNSEDRYLPRVWTVSYWNSETNEMQETTTTRADWVRIGDFDLPAKIQTVASGDGQRHVRELILRGHHLEEASEVGKP